MWMKISVLTPDFSHNCLSRAYLLAKILQRRYDVEIVGCLFGDVVWQPLSDRPDIPMKFVKLRRGARAYWQLGKLLDEIRCDVVYASKPLWTSFGTALIWKQMSRNPLVLDIDDWELGFVKEHYDSLPPAGRLKVFLGSALNIYEMSSYANRRIGEMFIRCADQITVSNRFLRHRFGGTIVWHGRDTEAFDPKKYDGRLARKEHGLGDEKRIVMYLGTPRPHKGIEDLVEAVALLKDQRAMLCLVGVDDSDGYSRNLAEVATKKLGERFKPFRLCSFSKVPEFLAMADIVAIPQRRSLASVGQLPIKIFDAMAMAKPIVASAVSDIPEILDGCGWVVEPQAPRNLADAIQYVLDRPEEGRQIGLKAREKCCQKYSWNAVASILFDIFEKYG
jgi:glycosyltransferase involved in cell wall biosynthesis